MNPGRTAVFLAVLLCPVARADGAAPAFAVYSIEIPGGDACVPLAGDFDGDGRADLLVWNGTELRLATGSDSGFVLGREEIELPEGARLFDVGDPDGDGVDALVYLHPEGVFVARLERGRVLPPERILRASCDLPGSYVGPAPLITDRDGDGRDEVWFVEDGCLETAPSIPYGRGFVQPLWPLVRGSEPVEPAGLPFQVHLLDLDGDRVDDLLCVTPDGLSAFRGSGFTFDPAAAFCLPFSAWTERKDAREFTDQRLEDVLFVEDVTGDGRPDLLLNSWSRGQALLFPGATPLFETRPSRAFDVGPVVTGVGSVPWRSFDRPGVVVVRFEMPGRVGALLRVLSGQKVTATLSFHLFEPVEGEAGRFSDTPGLVRRAVVTAGWADRRRAAPHRLFYTVRSDIDGDGWRDLATFGEDGTVEFFFALEEDEFAGRNPRGLLTLFSRPDPRPMELETFFEWSHGLILEQTGFRNPDLRVAIPDPTGCTVGAETCADLNSDGRADLLLPYRPVTGSGPARLVVLLSK